MKNEPLFYLTFASDARLQKLVQRIMMGELTKETQPQEALNTNIMTEEQP
jgi:hypothetical protein